MATPLEIFQEWESNPGNNVVHIMQIDRGDLSPENRLTLTDRPYYDKGVSGSKYHHTYPAPIHCILTNPKQGGAPIETNEQAEGTSFGDILLANGNGKFDDLLSAANIRGHHFTMLRGDLSWSLMETDYPTKFIEIFRGQVDDFVFERLANRVRLRISPVKYKMDNTVGSKDLPFGMGACFNIPAVLVDAASRKYRLNSLPCLEPESGLDVYPLRDSGVELLPPYDGSPDWVAIKEDEDFIEDAGGLWRGKFQLTGGSPVGTITGSQHIFQADPDVYYGDACYFSGLARRFVRDHVVSDYALPEAALDISSYFGDAPCYCFGDSGNKLYIVKNNAPDFVVHQMTCGTPYRPSTATPDGITYNLNSALSKDCLKIRMNDDDTRLYAATGFSLFDPYGVYQFDLSVANNISTASPAGSFNADVHRGFAFNGDFSELFYWQTTSSGNVKKRTLATPGDITTLGSQQNVFSWRAGDDFDFSGNGMKMYIRDSANSTISQLDLMAAYDPSQRVNANRSYIYSVDPVLVTGGAGSFRMSPAGDRFCMINTANETLVEYSGISDGLLPREIFRMDDFGSGWGAAAGGVWYNTETPVGAVLNDILSSLDSGFTVDRLGGLYAFRRRPSSPPSWMGTFNFYAGDRAGGKFDSIRHVRTLPALAKFTVYYRNNYFPQSEDQLPGSVSDADKAAFSAPHLVHEDTVSLSDYTDPGEYPPYKSFVHTDLQAESVGDRLVTSRGDETDYYDVEFTLRATSLVADFGLGRRAVLNFDGPGFSSGDIFQVVGRRVVWTKNRQTLTVLT